MSPDSPVQDSHAASPAVEVVNGVDHFLGLEAEWNALLARCPGPRPFSTFEWAAAWLATIGGDCLPMVIVVRGAQSTWAIAPFCVQRGGVLTFIGYPNNDYADVLLDPAYPEAMSHVVRALFSTGGWKTGLLDQFAQEGSQWPSLRRELDKSRHPYRLLDGDSCPAMVLDDPAAAKKQYYKKNINNYVNWFSKHGEFSHRICETTQETLAHLEDLFAQHIERWNGTATPSSFRREVTKEFYRRFVAEMDPKGWTKLSILALGHQYLALYLVFEFENVLYLYKPTFNIEYSKRSPGQVILRYLLDYALEKGIVEIDFMRGDESYKDRFANVIRTNKRIHLYRSVTAMRVADSLHAVRHSKLADVLVRNAKVQGLKWRVLAWYHARKG